MLIEAAKGGHTNVVQLLLDYPHSIMMNHGHASSSTQTQTPNSGIYFLNIDALATDNSASNITLIISPIELFQLILNFQFF